MPNYTYEASGVSEHSYAGGVTPLTLSTVVLQADSLEDTLETEEADIVDIVKSMIELNWRHLRDAFRPDDPSNLENIPVCGEGA